MSPRVITSMLWKSESRVSLSVVTEIWRAAGGRVLILMAALLKIHVVNQSGPRGPPTGHDIIVTVVFTEHCGFCSASEWTSITVLTHSTEVQAVIFWLQVLHGERPAVSVRLGGWKSPPSEVGFKVGFSVCNGVHYRFHCFSWQLSVPVHLSVRDVLNVTAVHRGRLTLDLPQQRGLVDITAIS